MLVLTDPSRVVDPRSRFPPVRGRIWPRMRLMRRAFLLVDAHKTLIVLTVPQGDEGSKGAEPLHRKH